MIGHDPILWAHAVSTCMLAGLIWFVQIVHYPLFAQVGPDVFARYERAHQRRTTLVVAPLMLTELACALSLVFGPPPVAPAWAPPAGLAMVALIWVSTATVQVPLHRRLEHGWSARAHRALVASNWGRTLLWTLRSILAIALLA
ncbi:MAG: hypothetical protein ACIARR_07845 [Phycisphaerales bacterium JB059]